jgi:ferredoxin
MKQIKYNRTKCIGCSACVISAPNIWELNSADNKADLLDSELIKKFYLRPLWSDEEKIMREIVRNCPVKVIQIL